MRHSVFKYRADIDGLRALAVILVVLFHIGMGFPGGYVGVDVFFVISGYLITRLIIKDIQLDRFSMLDFWERRIRRIFPALYVMVFATLAAGYFLLLPWDYEELGRSAIMQAVFASNFHFWSQSGYFDGPAITKPLLHTWSLAVEEQYYFLFPAILCFLWKRTYGLTVRALSLIWVLSLITSTVGVYYFSSATFYLLPMRAWELMTGALLAVGFLSMPTPRWLSEFGSAVGLLLIVLAGCLFSSSTPFPGLAALAPCIGAGLFIWGNEEHRTLSGRMMSNRAIVFVGLISYSLYLWHWPVIAFAHRMHMDTGGMPGMLTLLVLSFVLAILSWRYVERPFRKGGWFKSRAAIYKAGGAIALLCILCGLALDGTDGAPSRLPESVIQLGDQQRNPKYKAKHTFEAVEVGDLLPLGAPQVAANQANFLLFGDSHAIAIAPLIDRLAKEYQYKGMASFRPGTPPMLDVWVNNSSVGDSIIPYNQAVVDFVRKNRIPNVFLVARWGKYVNGRPEDPLDGIIVDSQAGEISSAAAKLAFEVAMAKTIDALVDVNVFIMLQVPEHNVDVPRELADRIWRGRGIDGVGVERDQHASVMEPVNRIFSQFESDRVHIVDTSTLLFNEPGQPILIHEGESLYRDEDHLSDAGAYFIEPVWHSVFESIQTRKLQ